MDTTDVTADATVALAVVGALAFIANVVIAAFTLKAARATKRSAEATEKAAKSTQDEADATREEAAATKQMVGEIERDRELAYRPYLSWRVGLSRAGGQDAGHITGADAWVVNFGRGPAIHCLLCIGWDTPAGASQSLNTMTTHLFDLSPNERTPDRIAMATRGGVMLDSEKAGTEVGLEPIRVAFCQDQLGNYYRFVPYRVEADVYRPSSDKAEPRWMLFYKDHFQRLAIQ